MYIGGVDVRDYDLEILRNSVAMVLQKNELFSGTIAENLRWGNKDATDAEIEEACKQACADEFIERFPDKYNTHIDQGGTNVSGGQKQRISIARALLKDAPILILDDSVSAVDTRTEKIILDNLKSSRANKTTLLIAHRISTVERLDKIIFLDDGKIEAVGPHDELYTSCPKYRRMVDLQRLEDEAGGDDNA